MMKMIRRSATSLIRAVSRLASPSTQDWAQAMLAELDSIGSDWAALLWALGSVRILFVGQTNHLSGLSDIPAAAKVLADRMRQRTWLGSVSISGMAVFFACAFLRASDIVAQVGYALVVAAMFYMLLQLYAGRPRRIPAKADLVTRTTLYRCELERERDFHSGYWFWSRLAVILPGFTLLCIGSMISHPAQAYSQIILLVFFLAVCALSIPRNLTRARSYARQIQDLDLLEE